MEASAPEPLTPEAALRRAIRTQHANIIENVDFQLLGKKLWPGQVLALDPSGLRNYAAHIANLADLVEELRAMVGPTWAQPREGGGDGATS